MIRHKPLEGLTSEEIDIFSFVNNIMYYEGKPKLSREDGKVFLEMSFNIPYLENANRKVEALAKHLKDIYDLDVDIKNSPKYQSGYRVLDGEYVAIWAVEKVLLSVDDMFADEDIHIEIVETMLIQESEEA